MSSWVCCTAKW